MAYPIPTVSDKFPQVRDAPDRVVPAKYVASASLSDTVNLDNPGRALYVGAIGDVRIMTPGGTVATFASVQGILPVEVIRVYSSGTNASSILVLW